LQDTDLAVGERTMPDELAVARLDFHGGITRVLVTAAICVACGLAAAYVSRLNGADPFG